MTQAQVLRELKEKEGYTFTKQYLSKLVKQGVIPFFERNGKKIFDYMEVSMALKESQQKPSSDSAKFDPKDETGKLKTINSTKIMLQEFQGKIAQQKFDVEAGKLVYREEVENKAFIIGRVIRDQMLSIPERLAGEVASSTDPREVKEIMYREINQVLEYISDEKVLYD